MIVKFNYEGDLIWKKGLNSNNDYFTSVKTDHNNKYVVTGLEQP